MLNQILPRQADNTYRGYKVALGLFGLLVLMKAGISLGTIFNGYAAASSADGIPLDTFTPRRRTGRSFSFRPLGALTTHDLLALCLGVGPISRNGPFDVCTALAGASE